MKKIFVGVVVLLIALVVVVGAQAAVRSFVYLPMVAVPEQPPHVLNVEGSAWCMDCVNGPMRRIASDGMHPAYYLVHNPSLQTMLAAHPVISLDDGSVWEPAYFGDQLPSIRKGTDALTFYWLGSPNHACEYVRRK